MCVRRLGDMRVRRSGGLVLRILIVELKAVAISVLSPVASRHHPGNEVYRYAVGVVPLRFLFTDIGGVDPSVGS
jgi:hypothetical protein